MKYFVVLFFLLVLVTGCYYDKMEEVYPASTLNQNCDSSKIMSYNSDIIPIINSYCKSCHNPSNTGGGIDLSTYSGVNAVATNGKLVSVIAWDGIASSSQMPSGSSSKISDCNIAKIRKWVNAGALNN